MTPSTKRLVEERAKQLEVILCNMNCDLNEIFGDEEYLKLARQVLVWELESRINELDAYKHCCKIGYEYYEKKVKKLEAQLLELKEGRP